MAGHDGFTVLSAPVSPLSDALRFLQIAITGRAYPGISPDGKSMHDHSSTLRKILRTQEAASYCGSSASTFEKLRLKGGGPVFVKIGRRVVYRQDDLDAWLIANTRVSTSDPGK